MITSATFRQNSAARLASLAAVVLLSAACWLTLTLLSLSRMAQNIDTGLLADEHQRQELTTAVERLTRYGEILLHAPEKKSREAALAETQALLPLVDNQDSPLILDKRSQEIFKAIFAQLRELAANRNEQDRFEGLIAKRLQTFDALAGSLEEQLPEKGDAWRAQLVLSKLRLELEHSDSTAETRWKLLTTELETQAKMLRLEGAGNIASILERVPEQVEDLAQLRQRVRTYHLSNHEQWNVAAQLLEKLALRLALQQTPAEQQLADLRFHANLALAVLLTATVLTLGLGYAALRRQGNNGSGGQSAAFSRGKKSSSPAWTPAQPPAAASARPETPDITVFVADETVETPNNLIAELRNLFAQEAPESLTLADSLRSILGQGAHKRLADEVYVRAAFGEYGKALESLEKLSGKLREDGETP